MVGGASAMWSVCGGFGFGEDPLVLLEMGAKLADGHGFTLREELLDCRRRCGGKLSEVVWDYTGGEKETFLQTKGTHSFEQGFWALGTFLGVCAGFLR